MKVLGFPGYELSPDPDCPRLIAPNGQPVGEPFGPGWSPDAVEEAAREHAERIDLAAGRLERLLEERRQRCEAETIGAPA